MILSVDTYGIVDPKRPGQGIVDILNSDFKSITLDIRGYLDEEILKRVEKKKKLTSEETDLKAILDDPEVLIQRVDDVRKRLEGKEEKIDAVISAPLPLDGSRQELKDFIIDITMKSIDIACDLKSHYVVIPPISVRNSSIEEQSDNRIFYLSMAEHLKSKSDTDLKILILNQCRSVNGHYIRGAFSDPYEAVKWIEILNKDAGREIFDFCLDIGAANLCGLYIDEVIRVLQDRIKMVLISDNDGNENQKLIPLSYKSKGGLSGDWAGTISGLRDIGFDGILTMELRDTMTAYSALLRPELMRLAVKVGEFIEWQINMEKSLKKYKNIVLFGAGNMCLNYMKCYGEKYPPLFTCDNNKSLWGTEFGGLKVQSPETLKELPEDTAVFICNLYYRDIEQQLHDMGISKIEFFSDEFLNNINMNRVVR